MTTEETSAHQDLEIETEPRSEETGSERLFLLSAALPALVGLIFVVQALQLGFGSLTSPGAGLWPFFFGAVLVVLAAVMIVTRKSETWPEPFARSSLMVVGAVLLMTFFISVLPVVGFEIPLFLLLLLWARFIGKESWRYGLLLGLFGTAAFVLIFSLALGLPLPRLIG